MSNKMTIKRTVEPVRTTKKEEKKSSPPKRKSKLAGMIPAIIFLVIAIWYLISSRQ